MAQKPEGQVTPKKKRAQQKVRICLHIGPNLAKSLFYKTNFTGRVTDTILGALLPQDIQILMSNKEPPTKKARTMTDSSSDAKSDMVTNSETYPVIDRVANGAHVQGMEQYQAM